MTYKYLFRDFMAKLPSTDDLQVATEKQQRVNIYGCVIDNMKWEANMRSVNRSKERG